LSEENVEIVQRLHSEVLHSEMDVAQLVRNDDVWAARVEAVAAFYHPDVESVRLGLPDGRTYTGLDGLRNLWLEWLAPWTTYRMQAEDVVDLEDRVLVLAHVFGRLEGSQAEVENIVASVWTLRDGKIARAEFYIDRAEALKAVGLED
jgi:ketosteroid isomerase-like protein